MEPKICVVCGQGSHRTDWIKKSGNFVACDNHSDTEITQAVAKATVQKPVAPAPAKSTPIPPATK